MYVEAEVILSFTIVGGIFGGGAAEDLRFATFDVVCWEYCMELEIPCTFQVIVGWVGIGRGV